MISYVSSTGSVTVPNRNLWGFIIHVIHYIIHLTPGSDVRRIDAYYAFSPNLTLIGWRNNDTSIIMIITDNHVQARVYRIDLDERVL